MRAVPVFWWTIVANLATVWGALVLLVLTDRERAAALPLFSLAASAVVGVVGLVGGGRGPRHRLGLGALAGAAASASLMVALLLLFFVVHFVLGGHELS